MLTINEPEVFRSNVKNKINDILENDSISLNLEKGIFNFSINKSNELKVIKKWDNVYFVEIYINKLKSILANISHSELKDRIVKRDIKAHEVAYLSHQEMRPSLWKDMIDAKKKRDENLFTPITATTDQFTCGKCKSKSCSYYQLQTRSADEPMTTFVSCLNCGARWKC